MKICVAFLVSLGFGLGCVSNANAQSACPPPSTSPSMTIKIFNDEPSGGRYIFPVFTTGAPGPSDRLQAWFCVNAAYTRTLLRRIYINPTSGIAPGQSVTLQIPLYTQIVTSPNPSLPDQYIDWWTGDTIELFFNTTNTTPDALQDELDDRTGGCGKGGECQTSLATGPGFPTCVGCAADGLQFFSDTASIGKSDPSQLIEFNLGALQLIAGRSVPNALDTSNVDFDVSYVNVAFGPAAMAPFQNDQSGYVGTPQTGETFETALKNFLGIGSVPNPNAPGVGWPQFVHTSSLNGSKVALLKLASPLEIFSRLTQSNSLAPPDLCGFSTTAPCSSATGQLSWPGALWPPIQKLFENFIQFAGAPTAPGRCGSAPAVGTFCAALMDVKALFIANYNKYTTLNPGCPHVALTPQTLVAHVYQWSPFVESTQGPACLGPNDNLLQNSSTTYSANNSALYHQVKLEFDQLNYNLLTDTLSYNFNPWVNVLIHGSNYVNAPNVYAYSVDDAVGNLQAEGTGFIIDVGSTKNLCTGATPCPNQNPAAPPININYALNPSFQFNFTNFGVCKFDPTDRVSYKSVNTLNTSFIISANNPKQCPIFFVDNKKQLYTFTITIPPAKNPPPYSLLNSPSPTTAAVIDCSGNSGTAPPGAFYAQSSAVWCCQKLADPNQISGVWAHSQPDTTNAHKSFDHFVITNTAEQSPNVSAPLGTCNMGQ
jgi:hypothetical protein